MKRFLKKMENIFMAITFAEAGERETAMQMAGVKQFDFSGARHLLNYINSYFAAVSFAEANCHQWADPGTYREQTPRPASRQTIRLGTFLRDVGLQNVRVQYAVALV